MDVWKEISLYLPYNFLALSKSTLTIYDESWFKDKIILKYPNCKKHNNSWESLYKRSLKSGKIIDYYCEISTECIKVAFYENTVDIILTFDDDLYRYAGSDPQVLIDSNVKDIAENTYIKDYEWHVTNGNNFFVIESEEKFLAVSTGFSDNIAITENKIYYFCNDKIITIDSPGNVNIIYNNVHMIHKSDGSVKVFDSSNGTLVDSQLPIVEKLYQGGAKLFPDLSIFQNYNFEYSIVKLFDYSLIYVENRLFGFCMLLVDDDKLYEIIGDHLLVGNNVYQYQRSKDDKIHKRLVLIKENVKNLGEAKYFIV